MYDFRKGRTSRMPVVVIVFWEMPIWLLVLAGLCVLGVSACEYNDVCRHAGLC